MGNSDSVTSQVHQQTTGHGTNETRIEQYINQDTQHQQQNSDTHVRKQEPEKSKPSFSKFYRDQMGKGCGKDVEFKENKMHQKMVYNQNLQKRQATPHKILNRTQSMQNLSLHIRGETLQGATALDYPSKYTTNNISITPETLRDTHYTSDMDFYNISNTWEWDYDCEDDYENVSIASQISTRSFKCYGALLDYLSTKTHEDLLEEKTWNWLTSHGWYDVEEIKNLVLRHNYKSPY